MIAEALGRRTAVVAVAPMLGAAFGATLRLPFPGRLCRTLGTRLAGRTVALGTALARRPFRPRLTMSLG